MSTILSIVALVVAVTTAAYAAAIAVRVGHRQITAAVITDFYASMRSLTELQLAEWRLAHLFEVVDNYKSTVAELRAVAPASSTVEATELRIKERAAALTTFGLYEHVIYQRNQALRGRDHGRAAFLTDAAAFFTDRLLQNPRLIYMWAPAGGNLGCEFEAETRQDYEKHITPGPDCWDEHGPYG
jgi:hypothetical protein